MSTEEAFQAAVNVIRSMPKDGPFQPSPDLMLRFYGLFKQATLGKNNLPKPSFWAVITKAKWDAWKNLGNMPKEEAMKKYVDELKQIIETMSYSENVANFMHVLGPFYEAVYDGQEPENLRRNPSPQLSEGMDKDQQEDESGYSSSINGTGAEETESADLETENNNKPLRIEEEEPVTTLSPATSSTSLYASEKFYSDAESDDEYKDPLPDVYPQSKSFHSAMNKSSNIDSGEQLHVTMAIQRLQADLQSINSRLEALEIHRKESTLMENGQPRQQQQQGSTKHSTVEQVGSFAVTYGSIPSVNQLSLPSWFPFKNVNVATIAVILGWPLLAQYLYARLHHRHSAV
ncbi:acyl-CoA-binding domain-containing protein 5-like [Daphnia pulicaria]|uniref:acyl-CoA-binding domain-containing protein 5-like n=1 Tax=Daphnia pulicaria TaxID=35523 RepID=UPI001EEB20A8|nr:acyl-CoA-binding domain-containing protein 5-like [Daphnia pulicaria]